MDRDQIKGLVCRRPLELLEMALTDRRAVRVHPPDQVIVTGRRVIFGPAQIMRTRRQIANPIGGETIADDGLLVDLIHVVRTEPINGKLRGSQRKSGRRK